MVFNAHDAFDAGAVLYGQSCDHRKWMASERRHGHQVGLNAGATGWIARPDRQNDRGRCGIRSWLHAS